ncbi:hypothetical protein DU976_16210 [Vibrio navarrensis]|uniref:hypothetical protein n=1 Tax=Vibrio navarrensis TaxID=29495 RepID=UPI001302A866|nr:hypothetical protein [Vibrio navarrensis]EGR2797397.1 hypothetical protein [Vibrio navarrensis]EKA5637839.1 hypothetical protein [Vibrio navarrensis]MBE4620014.1 hypothetical protein [Vibrio navarrensis]
MKLKNKITTASLISVISAHASAQIVVPEFEFFEGSQGSEDTVCNLTVLPGQVMNFYFKEINCTNDEARSLIMRETPAGTIIKIYDDPKMSTNDDYLIIRVKQDIIEDYVVGTFEESYSDESVDVTYKDHNGLDGKVSAARIVVANID